MKKILAASFLATLDEPWNAVEHITNKEFYGMLCLISVSLFLFTLIVHVV